jgi:hypothetical protein
MGLSLLATTSMPLKFWDQAFLTAAHLINRTPSARIGYDTPIHRLLCTTDYSNLHVFRCACWPNLRPYNTNKLQFRSLHCAFLGYSNLQKGYKCLDITTGRVYISCGVIFDENVFPFAALNSNAGAKYSSETLLLHPPSPPRELTDLPVINYPTNPVLPAPVLSIPQPVPPQ